MIQRQGAKIVKALKESIEDRFRNQGGASVFLDKRDLTPEFKWDPALRNELCRSAIMIVILVDSYFQSSYCRLEWAIAEELDRARLRDQNATSLLHVKLDATNLPQEVEAVGVFSGFERVLLYARNPTTHAGWPRLVESLTQNLLAMMDRIGGAPVPDWSAQEQWVIGAKEKAFTWAPSQHGLPMARPAFPRFRVEGKAA